MLELLSVFIVVGGVVVGRVSDHEEQYFLTQEERAKAVDKLCLHAIQEMGGRKVVTVSAMNTLGAVVDGVYKPFIPPPTWRVGGGYNVGESLPVDCFPAPSGFRPLPARPME